jgi:hypothetical protein
MLLGMSFDTHFIIDFVYIYNELLIKQNTQ